MKKKLSLQDFAEILAQREDIDRKAADAFARSFSTSLSKDYRPISLSKSKGLARSNS